MLSEEVQEASQTSSSERDNSVLPSNCIGGTRDITWEEGKVFQDFLVQYNYLMSRNKPWFIWKEHTRFYICKEPWQKEILHVFSWCSCEDNYDSNCPAEGCGRAFLAHDDPSCPYLNYRPLSDDLKDVLKIFSSS
eukprot:GHVP01007996.1.p1 GENE.GHVP01007996.1~~GHVP01007996.1.p1  ORF type:complete len:135 (-),score=17.77 GHVP01007996.1:32-436(-)